MGTPATSTTPVCNKSESLDSLFMAKLAAGQAEEKKGAGTVILDVGQVTSLADFFVITGGDSANQVKAIADAIVQALAKHGFYPGAIEGQRDGRWVLLDFGVVIVHVLKEQERNYYKLEKFWNQALVVDRKSWEGK